MKNALLILGLVAVLSAVAIFGYTRTQQSVVASPTPDPMIVVDQPKPGTEISSPLKVTGKARGTWFFEASFPVVLTDAAGKIIAQVPAQAQGEWMTTDWVPFEATVIFSGVSDGARGTLSVQKDNPSGLPENEDSREIPVIFKKKIDMPFQTNIIKDAKDNTNFRKVLFTGDRSQLVVMSIPPGGEVGKETHEQVEQTLFFLSGSGKAVLNGVESRIVAGDVVVVPPGTEHNFINDGTMPLKIYTVYAPPNHIDGRIHATKADADADVADEEFGHDAR